MLVQSYNKNTKYEKYLNKPIRCYGIYINFAFHLAMERQSKSKYYLFIDECGDHNLINTTRRPRYSHCVGFLSHARISTPLNKAFENLKTEIFELLTLSSIQ